MKKKKVRAIKVSPQPKKDDFLIVGIGASAGGLKAFTSLLKSLPDPINMALVLIQHLDPSHRSFLQEILSKTTKIPLSVVKNGMLIQPNHVYVIPPNKYMSITDGKFKLTVAKVQKGIRLPINHFFYSLAEAYGSTAMGVLLSGTGSDGALGLQKIKLSGGVTFVQDKETAQYAEMPQNAIAASDVNFVLSPQQIAAKLVRFSKDITMSRVTHEQGQQPVSMNPDDLIPLFRMLKQAKGIDFSFYKQNTIQRRVLQRAGLKQKKNVKSYLTLLKKDSRELNKLFKDILIHVTEFFRDPKTITVLKKKIFPKIIKNKTVETPIRIWIPGCSTGEEAYSIAIALTEFLKDKNKNLPIQIFGTDINETNIDKARRGVYEKNLLKNVSADRLQRFFIKEETGYKIKKQIRNMCIFSKQNVFKDPPFSNLDFISCKNLLIYLGTVLQHQTLAMFHYALKPTGYLLLGSSENIYKSLNLFNTIDKKHRIFAKKVSTLRSNLNLPNKTFTPETVALEKNKTPISAEFNLEKEADNIMVNKYSPPGVLIDSDMEILRFQGRTVPFLESPAGKPSLNLMKMARKDLLFALQTVINQAKKKKTTVKKEGIEIESDGQTKQITIIVNPITSSSAKQLCYLVLFEETEIQKTNSLKKEPILVKTVTEKATHQDRRINKLERELVASKECLQSIIAEGDQAKEELQSAYEELQSSNEELQSTNEELETAKEELQSSNEELSTLNQELQNRNTELSQINDDMINLLSSTNTPVIMLGPDLRIRLTTAAADRTLNIISSDIGRLITNIKLRIDIPDIEKQILNVIETLHIYECDTQDNLGHWYSIQIRPYRTANNQTDGVVIIAQDIDKIKKSLEQTEELRLFSESIISTMQECLLVLNSKFQIVTANRSFYQTFKLSPKEALKQSLFTIKNKEWNIAPLKQLLKKILPQKNTFHNVEVRHNFQRLGTKVLLVNGRKLQGPKDNDPLILLTLSDITVRKKMETQLRQSEQEFRLFFENAPEYTYIISQEGLILNVNKAALNCLGYTKKELIGKPLATIYAPESLPKMKQLFSKWNKTGEISDEEMTIISKKEQRHTILLSATAIKDKTGETKYSLSVQRDITDRKKIEEAVIKSRDDAQKYLNLTGSMIIAINSKGNVTLINKAGCKILGYREKEILGKNWFTHFIPKRIKKELTEVSKQLLLGKAKPITHFENPILTKKGTERIISWHNALIKDTTGKIIGHLSSGEDVTEIRKAEVILKKKKKKSDQLVTKRTKELSKTRSDLNKAKRLADIGVLASTVAHELRNPLGVIQSAVYNINRKRQNPDIDKHLNHIKIKISESERVINNLLSYSTLKLPTYSTVNLDKLLRECISSSKKVIKKQKIIIKKDFSRLKVTTLEADPFQLKEIFTNILINAYHALPEVSGQVEITAENTEKDLVCVRVNDNGTGVDQENLKNIFTPFFTTKSKGTGLGLSICNELVNLHGGTIGIASKKNKGTTVTITLPQKKKI